MPICKNIILEKITEYITISDTKFDNDSYQI